MSTIPIFRPATKADLPEIVRLLADDVLGATREDVHEMAAFEEAFVDVATLQLTSIRGLSHRGAPRAGWMLTGSTSGSASPRATSG